MCHGGVQQNGKSGKYHLEFLPLFSEIIQFLVQKKSTTMNIIDVNYVNYGESLM